MTIWVKNQNKFVPFGEYDHEMFFFSEKNKYSSAFVNKEQRLVNHLGMGEKALHENLFFPNCF